MCKALEPVAGPSQKMPAEDKSEQAEAYFCEMDWAFFFVTHDVQAVYSKLSCYEGKGVHLKSVSSVPCPLPVGQQRYDFRSSRLCVLLCIVMTSFRNQLCVCLFFTLASGTLLLVDAAVLHYDVYFSRCLQQ